MTIPYADLELHPPEDPEPEPRSGFVLVYVFVALGLLGLGLLLAATSRPAQEPTSYLGAGESLALASVPQRVVPAETSPATEIRLALDAAHPAAVLSPAGTIRGTASWFCGAGSPCTAGYSPSELIAAIDPTTGIEKGERVTVWHGDRSVTALVVDVCACPGDRIVDLSRAAFSRLADPSVGLIRVTLVPARGAPDAPAMTLPPTSTED